jgi:predicted dehydrogenase
MFAIKKAIAQKVILSVAMFCLIPILGFGGTGDELGQEIQGRPTVLLVGASGHMSKEYFEILKDHVQFAGFVSRNPEIVRERAEAYHIPVFKTLDEAIRGAEFEIALMAVPHHLHHEMTLKLLKSNKIVIKEKPLAIQLEHTDSYQTEVGSPAVFVTTQRRFSESFLRAKEDLDKIGKPISFNYDHFLSIPTQTSGWRNDPLQAGGGVVLDLGYHGIDVINLFFGVPTSVSAKFTCEYKETYENKLEDTAFIRLNYAHMQGEMTLKRHAKEKLEKFTVVGENGTMEITPDGYVISDLGGNVVKHFATLLTKQQDKENMLANLLNRRNDEAFRTQEFSRHQNNIRMIQDIYSNGQFDQESSNILK